MFHWVVGFVGERREGRRRCRPDYEQVTEDLDKSSIITRGPSRAIMLYGPTRKPPNGRPPALHRCRGLSETATSC